LTTTRQAIVAFVILTAEAAEGVDRDAVAAELRAWVGTRIGAIAKPRQITIVPELPKTRSGKIMRRLLRDAAEGRRIGDTTTLADPTIMATIAELM
jgi:acetyl-CoA synthetase